MNDVFPEPLCPKTNNLFCSVKSRLPIILDMLLSFLKTYTISDVLCSSFWLIFNLADNTIVYSSVSFSILV